MLKKIFKSWTVDFNILYAAVITILTQGLGMTIDPELIAAIGALVNVLLRFKTKTAIKDK